MNRLEVLAQDMYDLLIVAAPAQVRRDDIMAALGIDKVITFHHVKGVLQDVLAETDAVTLVGDPRGGQDGGWLYSLQGDPQHEFAVTYLVAKTKGIYTRQRRAYAVQKALTAGINGNTAAGRSARRLLRSQYRTLEDTIDVLAELGGEDPGPGGAVRTSSAEANGWRCPAPDCGDETTHDLADRGFVRHRTNPDCDFERGQRDDR